MNQHIQPREMTPGGLIPAGSSFHEQLRKGRLKATTAFLQTRSNWQSLTIVFLVLLCLFLGLQWKVADERFANNVRVEWVKLSPDGSSTVVFADDNKPVEFFQSTVDANLTSWVEKRYSKLKATVTTDYGLASIFMANDMRTDFMTHFEKVGAPKAAAQLAGCNDCGEVETKVRNIQTIDQDPIPGKKDDQLYTTLAFVLERQIAKDGAVTDCKNKIYTMLWHFRTKAETASRKDELRYNPLGQEIVRPPSERDDPTPVKPDECIKR